MQDDIGTSIVLRYFSAVDSENLEIVLSTLTEDCVFTVETHGVRLVGLREIRTMFERLWSNHMSVRHHSFVFTNAPKNNRIAVQFQVENTEFGGEVTHKSNCNFFELSAGRFSKVAVYMAGPNTLDARTDLQK